MNWQISRKNWLRVKTSCMSFENCQSSKGQNLLFWFLSWWKGSCTRPLPTGSFFEKERTAQHQLTTRDNQIQMHRHMRIQNPSQLLVGVGAFLGFINTVLKIKYPVLNPYIYGCGSQFSEIGQITTERTIGGSFIHPNVLWGGCK